MECETINPSSGAREGPKENGEYSENCKQFEASECFMMKEKEAPGENSDETHDGLNFPLDDDSASPVVTLRSCIVGFLVSVVGAATTQLFLFKPVHLRIQTLFAQIIAMLCGRALQLIPGPKWWNPGPFGMKETVFSSIMATSASIGAFAVESLAVEELYFDRKTNIWIALAILLSSQMIGYGWAGLLQPLLIYPSQLIYPEILPSVALFHSLFSKSSEALDQLRFFKKAFLAMGVYEIFPTYICPAIQAISLFCLSLPKTLTVTHLFGGAEPLEGMGFLSISGDWALVGAHGPLYTPLNAQIHHIIGVFIAILLFPLAYSNSWYNGGLAQNFPFMSVSLLLPNGKPYPIKKVIKADGTPDSDAIKHMGLPRLTATDVVAQTFASLAATSAITHAIIYNYDILKSVLLKNKQNIKLDPHRLVCKKYDDFPVLGFVSILFLSIILALLASILGHSGISSLGLLVATIVSSALTLAMGFLIGITGFSLQALGVVQTIGGLLFPGNAFGNMWFTVYGASTVTQAINMLKDLKLGQYMHVSQKYVVYSQIFGTLIGLFVNYGVMKLLVRTQREVLLSSGGNGVFSGFIIAAFNSRAVCWGSFSRQLFLADQKYGSISLALAIGLVLPFPFFILHRFFPQLKLNRLNVPLLMGSISSNIWGAAAGRFVNILIGLMSQFWARKYRHQWYKKYNYVLSAALDGGAQLVILFFALVFQGGFGYEIKFPTYFLNPERSVARDYCYMPRRGNKLSKQQ
ncbi:hypothetical protein O181_015478 [Austropuccinia psidii MF-1]|uniref:Oligopeptide transporter n=1 Tax=Austropuccinia psidii MF-1 TaxID=1389203 RepID=A0A9Q3GQ07_9BASI|nr:hypothetical protein [Austropuccinia psidii MF-1]